MCGKHETENRQYTILIVYPGRPHYLSPISCSNLKTFLQIFRHLESNSYPLLIRKESNIDINRIGKVVIERVRIQREEARLLTLTVELRI